MECINVENWDALKTTTKGSREKKWLLKPTSGSELDLYLFKESGKRYSAEFWSEVIAYEIGKVVNIDVPECHCAKLGDKYGALIKFFLKIKDGKIIEDLMHGGDLITNIHSDFDRRKGEKHNIDFVIKLLKALNNDFVEEFLRIIIFDAMIGNTDRHQDNWGIIIGPNKSIRLTPAFDNGASLGREQIEANILGFFEENELKLIRYINKGKPHLRWSVDGVNLEWIPHFKFLENLLGEFPIVKDCIDQITKFNNTIIDEIMYNIEQINIEHSQFKMSPERSRFINRLISKRKELLREKFLNE